MEANDQLGLPVPSFMSGTKQPVMVRMKRKQSTLKFLIIYFESIENQFENAKMQKRNGCFKRNCNLTRKNNYLFKEKHVYERREKYENTI